MKRKLLALALGAALSNGAFAAAISLPEGPIYFQFTNVEQVDTRVATVDGVAVPVNNTATCTGCSGDPEGNWGIAQVSIMREGAVNPIGVGAGVVDNDIDSAGTPAFFADQIFPLLGGQITAMFYGIEQTSITANGSILSLASTGGFIDFYWDDPTLANTIVAIASLGPDGRTSDNTFTGVTDGTFLGRLAFASGIDPTNSTTTIQGTIDTTLANISGSADSYANVVDVNGDGIIDSSDGFWAASLNSDWFGTVFGTRDVRFSNKIDTNTDWNGVSGVLGLTSNDPGRAYAVPEPATLALLGMGLLGMGFAGRRRKA